MPSLDSLAFECLLYFFSSLGDGCLIFAACLLMWRVRLVASRECSQRRPVADAVPLARLRRWVQADLVLLVRRLTT